MSDTRFSPEQCRALEKLPPLPPACKRQWCRCRKCGRVQFYDYLPYSLQNPIMTTACGHGAGDRDLGLDRISVDEALIALSETENGGLKQYHQNARKPDGFLPSLWRRIAGFLLARTANHSSPMED